MAARRRKIFDRPRVPVDAFGEETLFWDPYLACYVTYAEWLELQDRLKKDVAAPAAKTKKATKSVKDEDESKESKKKKKKKKKPKPDTFSKSMGMLVPYEAKMLKALQRGCRRILPAETVPEEIVKMSSDCFVHMLVLVLSNIINQSWSTRKDSSTSKTITCLLSWPVFCRRTVPSSDALSAWSS